MLQTWNLLLCHLAVGYPWDKSLQERAVCREVNAFSICVNTDGLVHTRDAQSFSPFKEVQSAYLPTLSLAVHVTDFSIFINHIIDN